MSGGRRRPSQRSEAQPTSGEEMSSPTAVTAMRLEACTRGTPYTWVRYGTPQSPTKATKAP